MKRCSACKESFPYENFYKNKAQKDGYGNLCIPCAKKASHDYHMSPLGKATQQAYLSIPEHDAINKQSKLLYMQSAKGKITANRYQQTPKAKASRKKAHKRWRDNHPEQLRAQWVVKEAIRTGRLPKAATQQCACGAPAAQWHHYKGYAPEHRLDVVALCRRCHYEANLNTSSLSS